MRCSVLIAAFACLGPASLGGQEIALAELSRRGPVMSVDTVDTYSQPRGGTIEAGKTLYVRSWNGSRTAGWRVTYEWRDSTGAITATQMARTMPGALELREERVRATTDSASLLVADGVASGWVVPAKVGPRLLSGDHVPPRYSIEMLEAFFGASRLRVGAFVVAGVAALYGANPLGVTRDTLRVVARQQLQSGSRQIDTWVLEHTNGTRAWVAIGTGRVLARRGAAGPNRYWWHVLRGVTPP